MRFTNIIISSVSTLALMSSALPIGETTLNEAKDISNKLDVMISSIINRDGLSKVPVLSGQRSTDEGDLLGLDNTPLSTTKREAGMFDLLKELGEKPLGQSAVGDVGANAEEDMGEEVSDTIIKQAFASANAGGGGLGRLGGLGGVGGAGGFGRGPTGFLTSFLGNSGGKQPSPDPLSTSVTTFLRGGGPDLSGLSDPFTSEASLTDIVKKRQSTTTFPEMPAFPEMPSLPEMPGMPSLPEMPAFPESPAWPSPTPGVRTTTNIAGTDLLSTLIGQAEQRTANVSPAKPGLLSSIPLLSESRGSTITKRREAVKATNAGRTPVELPRIKIILPDREVVKELPQDLLSMQGLKKRLRGRAIVDTSAAQSSSRVSKRMLESLPIRGSFTDTDGGLLGQDGLWKRQSEPENDRFDLLEFFTEELLVDNDSTLKGQGLSDEERFDLLKFYTEELLGGKDSILKRQEEEEEEEEDDF
ncbi:predicted protein [Pyrenophora tritici-repentis Pt-1C-BFP]|uniref:Uncharacterized protein n=1 Tax=Pyrenophora tritici-repentis (strain Pt-1C-BFP) TaxID=426418 RepID=B2W6R1_PYRTR|nr:uncharacterized protein PTRG_05499 [Pyrenophora tritici-repentis Pt-1C-BFP]EDU48419.1 predicted protein [Pyrenophora tritici-repentis Pt-1C-BFP]